MKETKVEKKLQIQNLEKKFEKIKNSKKEIEAKSEFIHKKCLEIQEINYEKEINNCKVNKFKENIILAKKRNSTIRIDKESELNNLVQIYKNLLEEKLKERFALKEEIKLVI